MKRFYSASQLSGILILFLFFRVQPVTAQRTDSMEIARLSSQLAEMQQMLITRDSVQYAETRDKLMNGFHNSYRLYELIHMRDREIADQQSSILLLNLNNPGTSQMIGRFSDYLKDLMTSRFSQLINGDTTRKRKIFRVLENIFQNPVLSPVLNSNPISGAINAAFNFVGSLVEPKVDLDKGGFPSTVKNVKVELVNMVENKILSSLSNDILPYIHFFDTLYVINNQFATRLDLLRQRSRVLTESFDNTWSYYKNLGIRVDETPVNKQKLFEKIFPETRQDGRISRYSDYLLKDSIRQGLVQSDEVYRAYLQFNELTRDYNKTLSDLRTQYTAVLLRYKDKLTIYATDLNATYTKLAGNTDEIKPDALVVNNNVSGDPQPDPRELKVRQSLWRYDWVDPAAREDVRKITGN